MLFRNHVSQLSSCYLFSFLTLLFCFVFKKNRFEEHGYDDGFREGEKSGELEGRLFGCEKAFDLGREVGFYLGCAEMWTQLASSYPETVSSK